MAVTLQQIAEAAGVSRGTVDRALNNRGRIRPEVEEKIKRIAQEMGYQPSRAGRALAMAKRKIRIGVILQYMKTPFMQQVLKGVMTVKGARKALEAGVQGIIVSNHGGRVLDQCPATAEVLPSIVEAVGGRMKIFVDGGIRSGIDVFKALAMGADAVLAARPFVTAVYGGREEGVKALVDKFGTELVDTMKMCGAYSLEEISKDMIWKP